MVLVKHVKDNALNIFALKQMKKVHILETKQEEHVFNERRIMLSCELPLRNLVRFKSYFVQESRVFSVASHVLITFLLPFIKCHLHSFAVFTERFVTQSSFIYCWRLAWEAKFGRS